MKMMASWLSGPGLLLSHPRLKSCLLLKVEISPEIHHAAPTLPSSRTRDSSITRPSRSQPDCSLTTLWLCDESLNRPQDLLLPTPPPELTQGMPSSGVATHLSAGRGNTGAARLQGSASGARRPLLRHWRLPQVRLASRLAKTTGRGTERLNSTGSGTGDAGF